MNSRRIQSQSLANNAPVAASAAAATWWSAARRHLDRGHDRRFLSLRHRVHRPGRDAYHQRGV